MWLSDVSIKRPVFAAVISLLLLAFGFVAFDRLPLREYPDIDSPVVSIETNYIGAAANVVETRITQLLEDRISGLEGVRTIASRSRDGRSDITVEFDISRDVDAAANDIRDRVAGVLDDLPEEADPPEIQKVDANASVIMWLNLVSENMTVIELTDYARRYLQDRFSAVDGVARVRVGGGLNYSMRVWLDRDQLAARNLTVADVESALRAENVELPAGSVESTQRQFAVRMERSYSTAEDFRRLVLSQGRDGYLVRLGDVARVEVAPAEERTLFRGNGVPMVGIGIIKQSTANTLAVASRVKAEAEHVNAMLPNGMQILESYDRSVFIENAISEVYKTLFIAIGLVILVIFVFLGNVRAMLIPAVTVPISLVATFIVLYALGFTINLLTLLALVLAIGLVVDDAIVVLENIHRRMEMGESALVAAYRGTRQVAFAVIATTLVLIAVFVPITFMEGDTGKLFSEFAVAMAAAVAFSSVIALSLSPMLSSKFLRLSDERTGLAGFVNRRFHIVQERYVKGLAQVLERPLIVGIAFLAIASLALVLLQKVPNEFAPREDRGAMFVLVNGPEGASYEYTREHMDEVERRLMPLVENGEVSRLLIRAPGFFGTSETFNTGIVILVLSHWNSGRRSAWEIIDDVSARINDLPGVRAFTIMRQGIASNVGKPVQFVLGGSTYEELVHWRDIILDKAKENPGLVGIDYDYKETRPQIDVSIDRDRAGDLGISIVNVGRTLETMLGSRVVTSYIDRGEEYDVILEGERSNQRTPTDLTNIYVRSSRSGKLIPLSNLVTIKERADASALNRYNRIRAITIDAGLAEGYRLGDALEYLEQVTRDYLPAGASIDYKGESLDFKESGSTVLFTFMLALLVVFLVLAAQFESFIHPFIIMLTVPLAMTGALLGLLFTGESLNIYSQIGIIMLIGLAAKNGILIVEFVNQVRDEGVDFNDAILEACGKRLRPIVMTGITTAMGSVPLILSSGAGAETRLVIGVVVFSGVVVATLLTLYIVPVAYRLFARYTQTPGTVEKRLNAEINQLEPLQAELRRKGAS